jgi:hypothetical protein
VNPTATMTSPPMEEDKAVDDLLASLESAVRGGAAAGVLNAKVLPAFGPEASWRPVSLADGLWAVVRTSADGAAQALCVHNFTDKTATFAATGPLPEAGAGSQLHFVRGSARTSETADGDIAIHVDGRSFVWLAVLGAEPAAGS